MGQCASLYSPESRLLVVIQIFVQLGAFTKDSNTNCFTGTAGVKEEIGFNPALCELSGHLLIKGKLSSFLWCKYPFPKSVIILLPQLLEPAGYDVVTEDIAADLLHQITSSWFDQVRAQIPNLFRICS